MSGRGAVVIAAGFVATLVGLGLWVGSSSPEELKESLRLVAPRTIELTFLLFVGAFVWSFREIRASLLARPLVPLAVFLFALASVELLPLGTHRIYYDEDIYQNVAQNILWSGRAEMCNEGVVDAGVFECYGGQYNKEPNAFPVLLSIVFRFTGVGEAAAHHLNHWVFALGAVGVYWVAALLFRRTAVALGAAVVYLLTPTNLLWGATVAAEPGAAAFAAVGLAGFLLFCREPSWPTALLGASGLALATQFRPESGLILLVAGLAVVLIRPTLLRRKELYGLVLVGFLLLMPHFVHLAAVRHEDWGASGAKFSMEYVPENLKANLGYYVSGRELPRFFTLLALLGLAGSARPRRAILSLVWFVLLFGIFVPFYAGSYRYGADIRFSLVSAAPFSVLAGAGMGFLSRSLARLWPRSQWLPAVPFLLAVYAFACYLPLVAAVGPESWASRADHQAALEMVAEVPEDSIVLTHNPGMLQVMGQSAAQTSMATYEPARVDHFFRRFSGGVYFHYSFWCNVHDPVQNEFCSNVLARYRTQVVLERRARFYRYVLYRLLPRSVPPPPPTLQHK